MFRRNHVERITHISKYDDTTETNNPPETQIVARSPQGLRRIYFWMIAIGIASSGLTNPGGDGLGGQPLKYLMKTELSFGPVQMAAFFAVGGLVFSFKPIIGLLTDSVPLFRTRRRWYLIISAVLAGLFWLGLGFVPHTQRALLSSVTGINICLMAISTVVGGLLVEAGQRFRSTGRLTSLRSVVGGASQFIIGPIGGFLATRPLYLTAILGSSIPFALAGLAFILLRERPVAKRNQNVVHNVRLQFRTLIRSRSLLVAVTAYFLFYFAPGFHTPLYFYQTNSLKLSQQFIGNLSMIAGILGVIGALGYGLLCRHLPMRTLLVFCIGMEIIGALCYQFYNSAPHAMLIEGFSGLTRTLAELALMDLAARATPRGSESIGYGLMLSIRNGALALGDVIGSYLLQHYGLDFHQLVWLNAGSTAVVFLIIPFLPGLLMRSRDDDPDALTVATGNSA